MPLKMYINDIDNDILKFVEKFGSITIWQAYRMFYNNQIYGNVSAGKHLNKLVRYNKLKVYKDPSGKINVYYDKTKLRYHDLLAVDFYVELHRAGANLIYFKQNQQWMKSKFITDAFCCYQIGEKIMFNLIEIVRTTGIDKQKYLKLFDSGEPQEFSNYLYKKVGGEKAITDFPKLIIIDNVQHLPDSLFINKEIQVKQLDFKFENFANIFL